MHRAIVVSLQLLVATAVGVNAQATADLTATARQSGPAEIVVGPTPNPSRARELRTRAEQLFAQPKHWRKAARLFEQSAELREANDPETYACLMYAARLRFHVNDLPAARSDLEKAAAHALARGYVNEAAEAYIDIAHVAVAQKQIEVARDFAGRAALLSESPVLTVEQRRVLALRLTP